MGKNGREFYVERTACTGCGDCIKTLPMAFRRVRGRDHAEVHQVEIEETLLPALEDQMSACPGYAIRWRKAP